MTHGRPKLHTSRGMALLLALVLAIAACGGADAGSDSAGEDVGKPQRGGSVTYALEAETTGGWCMPEAQLAISGIMVARTIYDTLTAPNSKGEYVPNLAKSVEPNEDFTKWTIGLRDGIKFHDGSPLTAQVVKNNLDAYRGKYPARAALLFIFVLQNVKSVDITGEMEVTVTTIKPWVAFPWVLFASGRLGIIAQAQLDDTSTCDTKLIGTGPFKIESWKVNEEFVAKKNPDYWRDAPDGKPYPYLDEIRFRPIIEGEQRVNALQAGDIDLLHTSAAQETINIKNLVESNQATAFTSNKFAEVSYLMINASKKPLDDVNVRKALALAIDRDNYKEVINQGLFTQATGPYAEGAVGYLKDSGYPPKYDVDEAKKLINDYEDANGPVRISYAATPGAATLQIAQYIQQKYKAIGVDLTINTIEQSALISTAITGEFDIVGWRNHPGGDPDEQYNWWVSGSPVNFGRIDDPMIDKALNDGRSETDPAKRKEIYEGLNKRFASQYYNIWANWTEWTIGAQPKVHGFDVKEQPKLPDDSDPFPGLATGHPVLGLWVEK